MSAPVHETPGREEAGLVIDDLVVDYPLGRRRHRRAVDGVSLRVPAGRSVGLVVGRILDIVETEVKVRRGSRRRGLIGSAVVQQHVTDLVDVPAVIRDLDPSLLEQPATA